MYLLDYKVNKTLAKIRDVLSIEFIDWLESKEEREEDGIKYWVTRDTRVELTPHKKQLATNAVGCFVSNVAFRLKYDKQLISIPRYKNIYSLPLIYNGQKVPRQVSYTYTMLLCEFIKDVYWCIEARGCVEWKLDKVDYAKQKPDSNGKKKASFVKGQVHTTQYKLSQELVKHFDLPYNTEDTMFSVIEVRDVEGKVIIKKLTPKQRHMVKILTGINKKYQTNRICIDEERLDFQLKKIYNNSSFELGGRNYMVGADASKAMKKDKRLKITINGEPCVELDFKSFFPSMMADMQGITFPEGFDPYQIEIDGCDPAMLRDLAKLGCLMLLNTDNMKAAQCALASELAEDEWVQRVKEAKAEGMWPEGRIVHQIIEKLIERNGYLMHECQSSNALKYMNYESEINDIVLERILMDGNVVIPLHDSFIVPISAEEATHKHMEKAYELVIGGNNCRISSKVAEA